MSRNGQRTMTATRTISHIEILYLSDDGIRLKESDRYLTSIKKN